MLRASDNAKIPFRKAPVISAVLVLILVAFAAYVFSWLGNKGELAGKSGWAALQGVEFADRGNRDTSAILHRRVGRYSVLGIRGIGDPDVGLTDPPASIRSWLILNEHAHDRRVRQINTYPRYDLGCVYAEGLRVQVPDLDDYVMDYLRSICR